MGSFLNLGPNNRSEKAVVVLDDLGFLDVLGEFVSLGEADEFTEELLGIDGHKADGSGFGIEGLLDHFEGAGLLKGDLVADGAEVGGDVNLLAIDQDVAMVDELAGPSTGAGESHTIDEIVQTGLEDAEEGKTSDGRFLLRDEEETAELAFVDTIEGAKLLLLSQLDAVFRGFPLAVLAVLARAIGALFEFVPGLQGGEIEVAGFLPRRSGVPRHISCLLSLRTKSECFLHLPGCQELVRPE